MTATSIFVCGRPKVYCSSHDCSRLAARLCAFTLTREGRKVQCDRPVCLGCVALIDGTPYCAAHGRVVTMVKARKP